MFGQICLRKRKYNELNFPKYKVLYVQIKALFPGRYFVHRIYIKKINKTIAKPLASWLHRESKIQKNENFSAKPILEKNQFCFSVTKY